MLTLISLCAVVPGTYLQKSIWVWLYEWFKYEMLLLKKEVCKFIGFLMLTAAFNFHGSIGDYIFKIEWPFYLSTCRHLA
jgi:hypothetical protein